MSTAINITVDDGGLPARNRQQVAANRQAFVQNVAAEQSTALGLTQRNQDRIAQGRDPATGALLVPPTSTGALGAFGGNIPRLNQEPAANRIQTPRGRLLLLDFSTASGSAAYTQTSLGGDTFGTIRLTGKTKYQGRIINSRYNSVTTTSPTFPRLLLVSASGGPFNQAFVSCIPSSISDGTAVNALYPVGYGTTYNSDENSLIPSLGSLISDPPPFVPPNFVPLFDSPHTIETDIFFPASSLLPFSQVMLRLSLVSNSILTNEKKLKEALNWFSSSNGRQVPLYGVELLLQRGNFFRNLSIGSIFYENESQIAGFTESLDAPFSGGAGWRRVAISFTNTEIKYFENSTLIYSKSVNLGSYFNLMPSAVQGFTWVPSISVIVSALSSATILVSRLSTTKYSDRTLGNSYTPARLS